ncbi:MAG: type protein [Herbinix sp.]|nr:type protein [Herbinix sp.]
MIKKHRKCLTIFIIISLLCFVFTACSKKESNHSDSQYGKYEVDGLSSVKSEDQFRVVLGEALTLKALNKGAEQLVNNSGMSGLWAANHLHNDAAMNMYLTDKSGEEGAFVFDTGKTEALGKMYLWNYNAKNDLDSGIKEMDIYYSNDNVKWNRLGTKSFELSRCSEEENKNNKGNMPSTINEDAFSIDFAGIPARYIKIIPVSNWGGDGHGLSEIRAFRNKVSSLGGDLLTVDAFTPRNDADQVENAFNNLGMRSLEEIESTHNNDPEDMWYSDADDKDSMIIINLDGNYPLKEMKIWNYNNPDNLKHGVKEFTLYYTTGDPCTISAKQGVNFNGGEWKRFGSYTMEMASGENEIPATLTIDLENLHAQHLKIKVKSNFAGEDIGYGLSEVRLSLGEGWAVEPERNWSGLLSSSGLFPYQNANFDSYSPYGWLAADGIHAINIGTEEDSQSQGSATEDSKTFITFQDTMQGNMKNYANFTPNYGYDMNHRGMINESFLMISGTNPDPTKSQFALNGYANDENQSGDLVPGAYWLADSTVIGTSLYTLGNHFSGLSILGADLLESIINPETGFPDFQNRYPTVVKEYNKNYQVVNDVEINFDTLLEGTGEDKDWIYTFARAVNGHMVMAKIKKSDFPKYNKVFYWTGSDWSEDINEILSKEAELTRYRPGNEFSVSYLNSAPFEEKYINVFTRNSIDGEVQMALSEDLTKGFDSPINLYYAVEKYKLSQNEYKGYDYNHNVMFEEWNYNAKAQPAISRKGELLITYHFSASNLPPINDFGFTSTTMEYSHPTFLRLYTVE